MSIRGKILIGCLSLAFVTVLIGLQAKDAQSQLGAMAFRIYDEAFMSMSYLRSAQKTTLGVARDLGDAAVGDKAIDARIQDALGDLEVAGSRAMSEAGRQAALALASEIGAVRRALGGQDRKAASKRAMALEDPFDEAVEVFAGDGFVARRAVEALVQRTTKRTWVGMALSLGVALLITALLSRAIVPSVRHAVRIATSIAAGRLDNHIEPTRTGETGMLLRALASMQASLAEKMDHIRTLMAEQATSHATEISSQHARFEAALESMSQGLCLFGPDDRLLVQNRRFAAMFGRAPAGAHVHDVLPPALTGGGPELLVEGSRSFTRTLADGRVIAVLEGPMSGGGWVATYEDVTERRRIERRLAHMARHDALTGLPNRFVYGIRLQDALVHVRRGEGLAVLSLDLDNFKAVNESLGHAGGDCLLRTVAERLTAAVTKQDVVVRLGSDEFTIIQLSEPQPSGAKALAERLIQTLQTPFDVDGHVVAIGVSIGIAVTDDPAATPEGLMKAANLAQARAKADGRNTYRFFEAEMDARIQARRRLEVDLREAVATEQFQLFYQPLVRAATGAVIGFEALIRWQHPTRGMVSPTEFIPVAEELGLIGPIGAWVMTRACTDAQGWPDGIKVAVNLSPLQFRDRALPGQVASVLATTGLDPSRLELEITESLLLQDDEGTLATLHELRGLGVQVSMDDFGTGYSSLSYLRRFPFDKIKIDQSFIRNLTAAGDCIAIVRAVVGLGHSLGITVVAEGVETEEQLALLRREGCHQVQGYLFSEPRPLQALPELIDRLIARAA